MEEEFENMYSGVALVEDWPQYWGLYFWLFISYYDRIHPP